MYTKDDLEFAQKEFDRLESQWTKNIANEKSNEYSEQAKAASVHLAKVEDYLKSNGIIPYTDDELAQEILNQKYPNAKSREVVIHNGVKYQKRFFPVERSKSGKTVKKWRSEWINKDVYL